MAARKSSRVNVKYKTKYRVWNWAEYDAALKRRGDVMVWFDEDAVDGWTPPKTGRRGAQPRYSDVAIVTALTVDSCQQQPPAGRAVLRCGLRGKGAHPLVHLAAHKVVQPAQLVGVPQGRNRDARTHHDLTPILNRPAGVRSRVQRREGARWRMVRSR